MSSAAAIVQLTGGAPRPAREDVQVTRARVLDTTAWIAFRANRPEVSRRRDCDLGAVLAWDLLDTLMDLPAGFPVPIASLTDPALRRVRAAAPGVARVVGSQVTRDLVPALTPLLAIVMAGDWDDALIRASRFAPYCPRIVVGADAPGGDLLATAARVGIGIGVRAQSASGRTEMLLEPEPISGWQPTTAWWRFCEAVYGHAEASDD